MSDVAILHSGMVTGVGLNAPASCAAIRVGITGFVETRFMFDGEWLIGSPVPFDQSWRGREKLLRIVIPAIEECLSPISMLRTEEVPLLVALAESDRPGGFTGLDDSFLQELQERMGRRFHPDSTVIAGGRIGGVKACTLSWELLSQGRPNCIVAGVDTMLVGATLNAYYENMRLLTAKNSNGFIPGEAGAALLIGPATQNPYALRFLGAGFGKEPAPIGSEEPQRAEGLTQAFKAAMKVAGVGFEDLDYRICDVSGEQYGFKEAALALLRTMRVRKEEFDIWHPADCIGEVGAAAVPLILGVAQMAARKQYAPGPGVLCHFSSDGPERAAILLYCNDRKVA